MGHIGDKIAPHGLGLLQSRDVTRQHEFSAIAVRVQAHSDAHRPLRLVIAPGNHHIVAVVGLGLII